VPVVAVAQLILQGVQVLVALAVVVLVLIN